MNHRGGGGDDIDDDSSSNWWMQNLYDMNTRTKVAGGEDSGDADYMGLIFGTPRGDGASTARGGPAFTPRGTLVALSQAHGKQGAALSLGMPKPEGGLGPTPEEDAINMGFASDWVKKVFMTPRTGGPSQGEEVEREMADAVAWLQANFGGATPRGNAPGAAGNINVPITPRGSGAAPDVLKKTSQADDAVFHAAMQATLLTPRAPTATASVDDTPMAGAVNKMFKGLQVV